MVDEPGSKGFLVAALVSLGWKFEVRADWMEARRELQSGCFEVLIADYMLAKGNALHFICTLRQQGITVPAILISEDETILRLTPRALLNIPAVLRKPFCDEDLVKALQTVLHSTSVP